MHQFHGLKSSRDQFNELLLLTFRKEVVLGCVGIVQCILDIFGQQGVLPSFRVEILNQSRGFGRLPDYSPRKNHNPFALLYVHQQLFTLWVFLHPSWVLLIQFFQVFIDYIQLLDQRYLVGLCGGSDADGDRAKQLHLLLFFHYIKVEEVEKLVESVPHSRARNLYVHPLGDHNHELCLLQFE